MGLADGLAECQGLELGRMPEALDLAQPARQWVPTSENLAHHLTVSSLQAFARADRADRKQESNRRARTGVFHLPSFIVGRSAPTRFRLEGYFDLGIAAWRRRSNGGSDAIGLLPDA